MRILYCLLLTSLLGLSACQSGDDRKETSLPDSEAINRKIIHLFNAVDGRNWRSLKEVFADSVFLDYASMTGQPGTIQSANQIIEAWSSFLPKFKFTHHQTGNMLVQRTEKAVVASCYGTAYHFIPGAKGGDYWIVIGNYDFELSTHGSDYRVTRMIFNFKFALGNKELPSIAMES